jgi:hypothetical protein
VALPVVIALNVMRRRFALDQPVLRDDGRIRSPFVRAVHVHVPLRKAIDQLLPGHFVTPTTFPVQ